MTGNGGLQIAKNAWLKLGTADERAVLDSFSGPAFVGRPRSYFWGRLGCQSFARLNPFARIGECLALTSWQC